MYIHVTQKDCILQQQCVTSSYSILRFQISVGIIIGLLLKMHIYRSLVLHVKCNHPYVKTSVDTDLEHMVD